MLAALLSSIGEPSASPACDLSAGLPDGDAGVAATPAGADHTVSVAPCGPALPLSAGMRLMPAPPIIGVTAIVLPAADRSAGDGPSAEGEPAPATPILRSEILPIARDGLHLTAGGAPVSAGEIISSRPPSSATDPGEALRGTQVLAAVPRERPAPADAGPRPDRPTGPVLPAAPVVEAASYGAGDAAKSGGPAPETQHLSVVVRPHDGYRNEQAGGARVVPAVSMPSAILAGTLQQEASEPHSRVAPARAQTLLPIGPPASGSTLLAQEAASSAARTGAEATLAVAASPARATGGGQAGAPVATGGLVSPVATVTSHPAQLSETVPAAPPMMPAGAQGHVESAAARAEPAGGAPPTVPREAEAVLRQLVGPITTLVSSGGRTSGNVTIALHPAELGRVELRVERRADGRLQIGLSAERADTLVLLRSDQAALERALTQAGLPPEGRSISFDLAGQGGSSTHSQFQADAEARGGRAGRAPERQDPEAAADTSTYAAPPPARHGAHQSRLDISI